MKITLAHISDLHLGPLPWSAAWKNFQFKRVIGALSWHLNRKTHHLTSVSQAIIADIKTKSPAHVAVTGDLINIAALSEFPHAARWLASIGEPNWVALVPGNHDSYVPVPWEQGMKAWGPYMAGEPALAGNYQTPQLQQGFPYVRFVKNMAIIGLTSSEPQSLRRAGGTLGELQRNACAALLHDLRQKGYFRTVLIHHPPVPGLCSERKALTDAPEFRDILQREGAELVLHGHNHIEMVNYIDGPTGKIPILGVPSCSMAGTDDYPAAAWNLYQIERNNGRWRTEVEVRSWDVAKKQIVATRQFTLSY